MSYEYASTLSFKKCKECESKMNICDSCHKHVCLFCKDIPEDDPQQNKRKFPTQPHALCAECMGIPVCHINTICKLCVKPYHHITDRVAIGDCTTPYDSFDIVINMDCPNNGLSPGKMDYSYIKHSDTHLIKCGIEDCYMEEYAPFATQVFDEINRVIDIIKQGGKKCEKMGVNKDKNGKKYPTTPRILFHCYAGASRSVTAAIYYLSKETGMSTKAIYNMVKEKRKVAQPNPCFMKILGL